MPRSARRPVRQMPKIYGNLQKPKRSFEGTVRTIKKLIWFAGLIAFLYAIFWSGWFSVKNVEVVGTSFSSVDQIKSQIPAGQNIWFLPRKEIEQRLPAQDRAIRSAAVLRGLPDSVKIVIDERPASLVWISGQVFTVLDENGFAFAQFTGALPPAGTVQGDALQQLPRVIDTKALPVELDHYVVGATFIDFIVATQANLASYVPTAIIDHIEIADTTYDVTFVAKEGLRVQFNSLGDSGVQVRNLARLINQKKAALTSQVDLRIDRWAYVIP